MERFRILRRIAGWLVPEYRLKWPHMAWWQDEPFWRYLQRFEEDSGLNSDRRWMMYQLLRITASLPGDTAECGAYFGAGSYLVPRAPAAFDENGQTCSSRQSSGSVPPANRTGSAPRRAVPGGYLRAYRRGRR